MVLVLAGLLFSIFSILSAIHFYWAFGGKWGIEAAIPKSPDETRVLKPPMIAAIIVGIGLLAFALCYLVKTSILSFNLPSWLLYYAGWIIPSIFLIRVIGDFKYVGLFKKIKTTRFAKADSKYFVPLCAFLAIAGFIVQTKS